MRLAKIKHACVRYPHLHTTPLVVLLSKVTCAAAWKTCHLLVSGGHKPGC